VEDLRRATASGRERMSSGRVLRWQRCGVGRGAARDSFGEAAKRGGSQGRWRGSGRGGEGEGEGEGRGRGKEEV